MFDRETLATRHWAALLLPLKGDDEIDEEGYRRLLRYFLGNSEFRKIGGLIVNAEAGQIFYMTREEKIRMIEIAQEEVNGSMPLLAGTFGLGTKQLVEETKDVKTLGVDGIFVMPPQGAGEVTRTLNPALSPDVWLDQLKAQDKAVDLPIITHPSASVTVPFGAGMPSPQAVRICEQVPNIIGWKILYNYDGYRRVSRALRALDRRVTILPATAQYFHEMLANGPLDGTVSGSWNYAMEGTLAHFAAWKTDNVAEARKIWHAGLAELHEYLYGLGDQGRLHIRYQIAAWLRGLIESPYMRAPMPRPRADEVEALTGLLRNAGFKVVERKGLKLAA